MKTKINLTKGLQILRSPETPVSSEEFCKVFAIKNNLCQGDNIIQIPMQTSHENQPLHVGMDSSQVVSVFDAYEVWHLEDEFERGVEDSNYIVDNSSLIEYFEERLEVECQEAIKGKRDNIIKELLYILGRYEDISLCVNHITGEHMILLDKELDSKFIEKGFYKFREFRGWYTNSGWYTNRRYKEEEIRKYLKLIETNSISSWE